MTYDYHANIYRMSKSGRINLKTQYKKQTDRQKEKLCEWYAYTLSMCLEKTPKPIFSIMFQHFPFHQQKDFYKTCLKQRGINLLTLQFCIDSI